MTREELKKQAALQYRKHTEEYGDTIVTSTERQLAFEAGWNAADEHPKNPWRDASKELPKSADEVFIYAGGVTTIGRYIQDENIWRVPVFGAIEDAEYWMPIPETQKGGMSDEK